MKKKESPEVPNQKLTYYNTTTKKQEVESYDYFLHLEKFGFEWQDASIEFKYSVELSTNNKKKINKKSKYGKNKEKIVYR